MALHHWVKNKRHILIRGIALMFLLALSLTFHCLWLSMDNAPPEGNGIPYVRGGLDLFDVIRYGDMNLWNEIKARDYGVSLSDVVFFLYYCIFGVESFMDLSVNVVYLFVAALGLYSLASTLFCSGTGLLTLLIFMSLPGVLWFSKLGYYEFHLMCLLPLALCALLKTDFFRKRSASVRCGLMWSVLVVTKYEGVLFLLVPFFCVLLFSYVAERNSRQQRKAIVCNAGIVVAVTLAGALAWYSFFSDGVWRNLACRVQGDSAYTIGFSLEDVSYYAVALSRQLISARFATVFLAGLGMYLLSILAFRGNKREGVTVLCLILSVVVPFLFFTFIVPKNHSHMLSGLIFIAILGALMVMRIRARIVRFCCIFLLLVQSFCMHAEYVWGRQPAGQSSLLSLSPLESSVFGLFEEGGVPYLPRPRRDRWHERFELMTHLIENDFAQRERLCGECVMPRVLFLANWAPLRPQSLQYYASKSVGRMDVIQGTAHKEEVSESYPYEMLYSHGVHYIVVERPLIAETHGEDYGLRMLCDYIENNQKTFSEHYELLRHVAMPDERHIYIYRAVMGAQ